MTAKKKNSNQLSNSTSEDALLLKLYLKEIQKIKLLTRNEEMEIARRARQGDKKAKETLVCANLRFVVSVARRYQTYNLSLIDLVNEGNIGLINSVEKFDPEVGVHLISFAVWGIRQAILQAVQQKSHPVRMPVNKNYQLRRILKVKQELEEKGEGKAKLTILSEILNTDPENIKHLLDMNREVLSLDSKNPFSEYSPLLDSISDKRPQNPEELLTEAEMKYQLNKCLEKLSQREHEVLKMRFGLGHASFSLKKVGQIIGLSQEQIRQIEVKAIHKMRNSEEGKQLFAYLQDYS